MVVTLVAAARRPLQAGASTRYIAEQGLRRHRRRSSRSPARSIDDGGRVHRAEHERLPRDRRRPSEFGDRRVPACSIVAEKFQTGFDQPLLHTMYVDKTLDRAQRRADALPAQPHPPGQDRHVRPRLPQRRRGHPGGVRALLRGAPSPTPTDPNLLYDTRRDLDDFDVLRADEVEAGVHALLAVTRRRADHGAVYAAARPGASSGSRRSTRRSRTRSATRSTRFVARLLVPLADRVRSPTRKLERDYLYCRALASLLPGAARASGSTSAPRSS